jgi:hypothetical protein
MEGLIAIIPIIIVPLFFFVNDVICRDYHAQVQWDIEQWRTRP